MLSPLLAARPGLSAQLSDEDISVTGTLGEDQLVSWTPLIKLWSCHDHAATAATSCSLSHLPPTPVPFPLLGERGADTLNEEWAVLLKQMPVPPQSV